MEIKPFAFYIILDIKCDFKPDWSLGFFQTHDWWGKTGSMLDLLKKEEKNPVVPTDVSHSLFSFHQNSVIKWETLTSGLSWFIHCPYSLVHTKIYHFDCFPVEQAHGKWAILEKLLGQQIDFNVSLES